MTSFGLRRAGLGPSGEPAQFCAAKRWSARCWRCSSVSVAIGAAGRTQRFRPVPRPRSSPAATLEDARRAGRPVRLPAAATGCCRPPRPATPAPDRPPPPRTPPSSAPATPSTSAVDRPIVAPRGISRPGKPAKAPKVHQPRPGPRTGGVWAVVVGIDDYPGEGADLRPARPTPATWTAPWPTTAFPADRRVLLSTAGDRRQHPGRLAWVAGRANSDATVVFFFSGHIRQVTGYDDRDGEAIDEALVAADGEPSIDGEVADILRRLEARPPGSASPAATAAASTTCWPRDGS